MMETTFFDELLAGREDIQGIHDWIDKWHMDANEPRELWDFLGFRWAEYSLWVLNPENLPKILEYRKVEMEKAEDPVFLNVNETVAIKLNDFGYQILREYYAQFEHPLVRAMGESRKEKEDEEGYSRWQLCDLMQVFGSHMKLGEKVPFDTNICINPQKKQCKTPS